MAGNTTLVFGAAVADWIPVVMHYDDEGIIGAYFMTARQATSSRWEVMEVGYYGRATTECEGILGQYGFAFSTDCESLTVSPIYDECESRVGVFEGLTFTQSSVVQDGQCDSWMGVLQQTSESPRLSGEKLAIYPAPSNLAIVSIGDYTAIFQQWAPGTDADPPSLVRFQDLLSVPEGYACEERFFGQYLLTKENGCGAILCGKTDSCPARAHLFHGVHLNDYEGGECEADIEVLEFSNSACSDGNIWKKTPQDCVGQFGGDQCMFCRGSANNLDVKLCIDRNGAICNDIFRSYPSKGWCNLEMECPASTLSFSVFALLSVLFLALFF
jgi:hypothetical protein